MIRIAIALATTVIFAAPVAAAERTDGSANPASEQAAAAKPKPKKDKKEKQDYLIVTMENVMITSY